MWPVVMVLPQMATAEVGDVKVLQFLVQCGADVNAVCIRGTAALHHAAQGPRGLKAGCEVLD